MNNPLHILSLYVRNESSQTNTQALLFLILWYLFSASTLFLNKYIVAYMKGSPMILAVSQLWVTMACGLFQMRFPLGMYEQTVERRNSPKHFYRNMAVLGSLRFAVVFLGLVALNYVPVSFTETIKSTAPAFTVIISRVVLGEVTGLYVWLSLIPVMGGLALCSVYELSYNAAGFIAALATNVSECLQFVVAKMLISGNDHKYSPAEMQFYTALASLPAQVPALMYLASIWQETQPTVGKAFLLCCIVNGMSFHFQTMSAWILLNYISSVTHSVANTAKRALLIWLSVLLFGNPVTFLSGLGTMTVIFGVLLYNKATEWDRRNPNKIISVKPNKLKHSG